MSEPLALAGALRMQPRWDDKPYFIGRLQEEAPWLSSVTEWMWDHAALRLLGPNRWFKLPPLLLVGPPGTGKTHFARLLSDATGVPRELLSVAGSSDNRVLEGTARGFSHSYPCWPVISMHHHRVANPILVIDEIDKAGGSDRNGRVIDTLLAMLEPQTASAFFDPCLMANADLSNVNWILTANGTRGLPAPLLSRVEVIHVHEPGPDQFGFLVEAHRREIARRIGCEVSGLPELGSVILHRLAGEFARHRSVRLLQKGVEAATGKLARRVASQRQR